MLNSNSSDSRYKNLVQSWRASLRSQKGWLEATSLTVLSLVTIIALGAGLVFAQGSPFTEQFAAATSAYFNFLPQGGSTITSNVADGGAVDGKVINLTLPAFAASSPNGGPNLQSALYSFGTYEARLKTADCSMQPNTGAITGFFNYINDGTDQDSDGVKDNIEIDFEWLCAEPHAFWITMWTDFQESPLAMRRVYREIDLKTGVIRRTCYSEGYGACTQDLTGSPTEGSPSTIAALSSYNSSTAFYTYGFTWLSNRVTWYYYHPSTGQKIILWDYQGPSSRIPQRPAYYMFNLWHTNNWSPTNMGGAVEQPNSPRTTKIDWATYGVGAPPPTNTPCAGCPTPTNTPPATATPNCFQQWVSTTVYPTGSQVTRFGQNYQANYQTIGEDPAQHNSPPGGGQPWWNIGACGGGGPTSTPTNTVPPTNTPTRTNTPSSPTNTPTNTSAAPTNTPTRTNTPSGPTNTPTRTNTPTSGCGTNVALGKPATGSSLVNPVYVTDGDKNTNNFGGLDQGLRSIVIDLGQNYNLTQVKVWHYFGDGRTYNDVIVQLSTVSNFSPLTTVFNNDTNNSAGQGTGSDAAYAETSAGKTISFGAVSARYIRLWSNGSSANVYNHYVEVEACQ